MTVQDAYRHILGPLRRCLGEREGTATADIVFEDIAGYGKTRRFADGDRTVTDFTLARLDEAVRRVLAGEPVQYVTGKAPFYGMMLHVTPAVLIPRPETAMLVDKAVELAGGRADLRVLDIGTGSGCIAIALARNLAFARVEAVDISADALAVARSNAATLRATVDFSQQDIFRMTPVRSSFDIIISNPPYILPREKADLDPRVADFEPAAALFAPRPEKPLAIYSAIAAYAAAALSPGGVLLLEINSMEAGDIEKLLSAEGFADVCVWRDQFGNMRFARARKPDHA